MHTASKLQITFSNFVFRPVSLPLLSRSESVSIDFDWFWLKGGVVGRGFISDGKRVKRCFLAKETNQSYE